MKGFTVLMLVAMFIVTGCIFSSDDGSYSISGRVYEWRTWEGVEGHKVRLWKYGKSDRIEFEISTLTDSQGDYSFTGLSNGSYGVACRDVDEYYTFRPWRCLLDIDGRDVTDVDFTKHWY